MQPSAEEQTRHLKTRGSLEFFHSSADIVPDLNMSLAEGLNNLIFAQFWFKSEVVWSKKNK